LCIIQTQALVVSAAANSIHSSCVRSADAGFLHIGERRTAGGLNHGEDRTASVMGYGFSDQLSARAVPRRAQRLSGVVLNVGVDPMCQGYIATRQAANPTRPSLPPLRRLIRERTAKRSLHCGES